MGTKPLLITAPQLIDRGTWMRQNENPEPFTKENALKQLSESPLSHLSQLKEFQDFAKKCELKDLSKKIAQWQDEFLHKVFSGKKEKFWSYVADGILEKYFTEVEVQTRVALKQNQPFLGIGGSHAIAWPISKAIFNYYNSMRDKISVIFFDDHEDNYGQKLDRIRPSMYHGAWAEVVRRNFNYSPFWVKPEVFDSGNLASELKGKKFLYLSVDVDVFDLNHAPSTFYARFDEIFSVGTMTYELWQKYLTQIKKVADENYVKILGADISEFVPYGHKPEENKKTAELTAKILNDLYHLIV